MLARFVDPRFFSPAFALFLELGPGKSYSSIEGVSICLSIPTRVRDSFGVAPYTQCSNHRCDAYTHAGLALAAA